MVLFRARQCYRNYLPSWVMVWFGAAGTWMILAKITV